MTALMDGSHTCQALSSHRDATSVIRRLEHSLRPSSSSEASLSAHLQTCHLYEVKISGTPGEIRIATVGMFYAKARIVFSRHRIVVRCTQQMRDGCSENNEFVGIFRHCLLNQA